MGYSYIQVARDIALRAGLIEGGSATERESAYTAADLEAQMDGVELPYSALRSVVLTTARELAAKVASSSNPLFRRHLVGQSSNLADGAAIPLVDSGNAAFIGAFDGFFDPLGTPDIPLTEAPLQQVLRYIEDQARTTPFWKTNPYNFAIDGTILRHTCTNVVARGCVWDASTQETLFDTAPTVPTAFTFTSSDVNATGNYIAETGHGLTTGTRVTVTKGTGDLPGGLTNGQTAFIIVYDANNVQLATSRANALSNTAIDFSSVGTSGVTPHSITPLDAVGGGTCPLPAELELLHVCEGLSVLAQEDWFSDVGQVYQGLATKRNDIIEGRYRLMTLPSMPVNTASVDAAKD